jgi:hypothetical protein
MFYLAVVPALLLSGLTISRLLEMEKHDTVLFQFCEIRRDIMRLLRERGRGFSPEDYAAVRILLDVVNETIHGYHREKRRMFDGREFMRFLREYEATATAFEVLRDVQNPEIQKLRDETGRAMVVGFFRYTPFLRSEITARVLFWTASIIAKLGYRRARTFIRVLTAARGTAKQQGEEFGYASKQGR